MGVFFFKQKTAYEMRISDWSSDVCSSDLDQVIYQWNGASPQRLQQFANDYEPAILQMPTNYRCPSEVIEMANRLVANNRLRTANKQPLLSGKALPIVPGRLRGSDSGYACDEPNGIEQTSGGEGTRFDVQVNT